MDSQDDGLGRKFANAINAVNQMHTQPHWRKKAVMRKSKAYRDQLAELHHWQGRVRMDMWSLTRTLARCREEGRRLRELQNPDQQDHASQDTGNAADDPQPVGQGCANKRQADDDEKHTQANVV